MALTSANAQRLLIHPTADPHLLESPRKAAAALKKETGISSTKTDLIQIAFHVHAFRSKNNKTLGRNSVSFCEYDN